MQRSSVALLPDDVRQELEKRLIQGGFAGYTDLAEWLNGQGFEISRSAVHRYGKQFEDRLQALKVATDQAKAMTEASEDDAGAMNEAIIRMVQTKTFELLLEMNVSTKNLPKIGQMVAKLAQAAVRQKKWQKEMENKAKQEAIEEAAQAVEKGATAEQIRALREQYL